jgi:hypothetical protein
MEKEKEYMQNKIEELEKTLEEMGLKLEKYVGQAIFCLLSCLKLSSKQRSQLKIDDIKEVTKQLDEFQWEQDDKVTICKICNKDFNVARRKHHCRRCGGIFCNHIILYN